MAAAAVRPEYGPGPQAAYGGRYAAGPRYGVPNQRTATAPPPGGIYKGGAWPALPPIPAGYYDPIRDINIAEGKAGEEQGISGLERQKTNAESQYGVELGQLGKREGQAKTAYGQTLARLAEGYAKLGVRQGEQANASGTLYGGALLAAAAKRAGNEGVQKAADERARKVEEEGFEGDRGRLSLEKNQTLEGIAELIRNAHTNQQRYAAGEEKLKGNEAAQRGYDASGVVPYERNYAGGGSVRVGPRALKLSRNPTVRRLQEARGY